MDSEGDFVAAWESQNEDGSGYGVFAQRFAMQSGAATSQFQYQVNTYTTGSQFEPRVASDAAGDYVVVWATYAQDGSQLGIYAERYNAAGVAQGSGFQVNTYTTGNQAYPVVAMDSAGDFVIAWQSFDEIGGSGDTTSTPSAIIPPAWPKAASSKSIPTPPAISGIPRWLWIRPAISSSPGRAAAARTAAVTASTPALQFERRDPGEQLPGQYLHDGQPVVSLGGHGFGRRFRHRLGERRQRGRQRLRHLRPALQFRRRGPGEPVPGQYLHDELPSLPFGGPGRRGRLCYRLAELRRGRWQRLRHLRPTLQCERRDPREPVPGQFVHDRNSIVPLGGHGYERRFRHRLERLRGRHIRLLRWQPLRR